jgi:Fe-S-cluster containining protein
VNDRGFEALCSRCGLCCRNLHRSTLYQELDRGDGVCRYLDETTNLCRIYEKRPLVCRVDAAYEAWFQGHMSRADYYAANLQACRTLQEEASRNAGAVPTVPSQASTS